MTPPPPMVAPPLYLSPHDFCYTDDVIVLFSHSRFLIMFLFLCCQNIFILRCYCCCRCFYVFRGMFHYAAQPGILCYCVALYDFAANEPNQLSFSENDKISVISKTGRYTLWWKGKLNGQVSRTVQKMSNTNYGDSVNFVCAVNPHKTMRQVNLFSS